MTSDLILKKLDMLKKRMMAVIMADNVISEDEQFLLDQIDVSTESLTRLLENWSNDKGSKDRLVEILRNIEDDALDAAEFDDLISQDEMGILSVLFDGFTEMEKSI